MRLLNVYTFKLVEFELKKAPPYTTASHRWCEDEASFEDVTEGKNTESEGYKKVQGFCEFVKWRNNGLAGIHRRHRKIDWIWLDSVCIEYVQ